MQKLLIVALVLALGSLAVERVIDHPARTEVTGVQVVTGASERSRAFPIASQPQPQPSSTPSGPPLPHISVSQALKTARGRVFNEPDAVNETRDEQWATSSEISIRKFLDRIPDVNRGSIDVFCGATVCRASGKLNPGSIKSQQAVVDEKYFPENATGNFLPKRSAVNENGQNTFTIDFARIHR